MEPRAGAAASPAHPAHPGGLSEDEALRRLRAEGYNELSRSRRRTLLRIAIEVGSEPMFELLLAASAIYFAIGALGEALVLLGSAVVTVAVAIVQEHRTERVLEALRDLSSPRALVVRGGLARRIPGREVVRGDVVVVAEGDRVPADAVLLSSTDLEADESLLTGESVPVRKRARTPAPAPIGALASDERGSCVFAGTMIVRGHAVGEVFATGASSEIGKIGKALAEIAPEPGSLQLQVRRLVRALAAIGIGLSVLVFALYVLMRGSWLDGLLAGITLAMSLLPEEFPLVLTIFLVMGAWRISKVRVLTRRASTIEGLGAATVLCSDKTGTLTLNRMSIVELRGAGESCTLGPDGREGIPEKYSSLVNFGVLASDEHPFDPMERAFNDLGRRLPDFDRARRDWTLALEYPLTAQLLAVTHVWRVPGQETCVAAAKGAPEAIARLCRLDERAADQVLRDVDQMAARGLRVIGVASASLPEPPWPDSPSAFQFRFLGLVGLADPLRPGVRESVDECRNAGIRVLMITGDYPATARAVAEKAGLELAGGVVTGAELAKMSDAELRECVKSARVFARTLPEQKLRLVNALKANGEIVAMTGDGVNDAPSLKAAHIGIAMGGRGTDVAREASAIVLLDDDFGSIVKAVRLGRRIHDNLRKAMNFLLAVHVPIAGLSLLPIVLNWPLLLMPLHIAFLELIIDPVVSIVFEAEDEERDIMHRPPRNARAPLFSPATIGLSVVQGACVLILTTGVLVEAHWRGMAEPQARALTFASLVLCNIVLIFANRSFSSSIVLTFLRPNFALWLALAATAALLAITLTVPPVRALFAFGPLSAFDLARLPVVAVAALGFFELLKLIAGRRLSGPR